MKKILFLSCLIFIFSQLHADAAGLIYTNASYPIAATGAKVENPDSLKKGTSSTTNILYLVETGDAGIDTAAKNGGIKKISYIDVSIKSIFIFWAKTVVTVYGE